MASYTARGASVIMYLDSELYHIRSSYTREILSRRGGGGGEGGPVGSSNFQWVSSLRRRSSKLVRPQAEGGSVKGVHTLSLRNSYWAGRVGWGPGRVGGGRGRARGKLGGVRIWGDFILKIADLTGVTGGGCQAGQAMGRGRSAPGLTTCISDTAVWIEGLRYTVTS